MAQDPAVKLIGPDEGQQYTLVSDTYTFKATGEDTGGAYTLFTAHVPPGGGPPPHIHHREDESFTVLEGEFEFLAGDRVVRAGPGDFVFGPRDIPHNFKNVGTESGRLIIICSPAGFEHFVAETAAEVPEGATRPDGLPDLERLVEIAGRYGIEILPPPG